MERERVEFIVEFVVEAIIVITAPAVAIVALLALLAHFAQ